MALLDTAYHLLVSLHITFYSLFIGGWFMVAVWKASADRGGDPGTIADQHERIAWAESKVIIPLGFLGFFLGYLPRRLPLGGPFTGQRITADAWTTVGMLLWFAGMAVWWFGMRRVEDKLIVTAREAAEAGEELGGDYAKLSIGWFLLDALALLAPVLGVFVMVFKPGWW